MEFVVGADVSVIWSLERLLSLGEKRRQIDEILLCSAGRRQLGEMGLDQYAGVEDLHDRLRFECAVARV
jgi:hypothetical protein